MKVGDLVRDTERGDLGLVTKLHPDNVLLVKVVFNNETGWFSYTYLEVINESR